MKSMPDVSLVLMPFAAVERPSLALGLLKSCLRDAGIDAQVEYANLDFVEFTSLELSEWVTKRGPEFLLGEWVFAGAAFSDEDFEVEKFFGTQPNDVGMEKFSKLRERFRSSSMKWPNVYWRRAPALWAAVRSFSSIAPAWRY